MSLFLKKASPVKDVSEKPEQEIRTKETERPPSGPKPRHQPSALFARGTRKAVRSPQRSSSKIKEKRHPFALYGWGEKQTDTGSQKTHNVCASAPVHEVRARAPASPLLLGGWARLRACQWLLWSWRCCRGCCRGWCGGLRKAQNWASDWQTGGFWRLAAWRSGIFARSSGEPESIYPH